MPWGWQIFSTSCTHKVLLTHEEHTSLHPPSIPCEGTAHCLHNLLSSLDSVELRDETVASNFCSTDSTTRCVRLQLIREHGTYSSLPASLFVTILVINFRDRRIAENLRYKQDYSRIAILFWTRGCAGSRSRNQGKTWTKNQDIVLWNSPAFVPSLLH